MGQSWLCTHQELAAGRDLSPRLVSNWRSNCLDSDFTGTQVLQIATLKHTKKHTPNVPESRRGRTSLCDAAGTDCPIGLHVAARGPVCGAVLCPISDTVCDSITVLSCLRSERDPLCHNDSCHITICTVHTAQKCRGGEWRRSFLLGIPTTRMQFPFVKLPALRVLSLDDVIRIWDGVSQYMLQQFALKKGVAVDVLGVFYIQRKHSSEVNGDMVVPRFHLSERVAQAQGLSYTSSDIPDDLKVVPLDYSQLSQKTSIPEKLVKECVNDIVVLFSWGAGLGEDYDLVFKGIGCLMGRNKILTMRYHTQFLLAIDGTGTVLECLLSNPWTKICVLSGKEPEPFHVRPGGIRVLPAFKIKLPPGRKAEELSSTERDSEKETAGSPQAKPLHHQKKRPLKRNVLKAAKDKKGQQDSRRKTPDSNEFSVLLASLQTKFEAEKQEVLAEDLAKERESEGRPPKKPLLPRRRLSPVTLPVLKPEDGRGEQAAGDKPPERSEPCQTPSATPGLLQHPRGKEGIGRPPKKPLLPQRRLSPVTLPVLKPEDGRGEQAAGDKPPESVLPDIERDYSKEGKSKMTHRVRRKTEIPACKGHQRAGQEVCYLCMQQEEQSLRAALLKQKEEQERAERAELQAWKARMAALHAQRARAAWKLEIAKIAKTEKRENDDNLKSYWSPPPSYTIRREYDRELQERREVWGKEPKHIPVKTSLQCHQALPAIRAKF
ncbi:coiled-coil domain-containing protein 81-like isoform X2 [Anser cygnoides]|uniref:coiled-coil domain-containing protein 81-like isoform X2 n=1 Tax=Anser cygnoides TaxID=8845 RepID=UPI0034D3453F